MPISLEKTKVPSLFELSLNCFKRYIMQNIIKCATGYNPKQINNYLTAMSTTYYENGGLSVLETLINNIKKYIWKKYGVLREEGDLEWRRVCPRLWKVLYLHVLPIILSYQRARDEIFPPWIYLNETDIPSLKDIFDDAIHDTFSHKKCFVKPLTLSNTMLPD